ncbi:MAG: TerB family tellurite resistance protein [Bradymonadia bacterium]
MKTHEAAWLLLGQMALADGKITEEERQMLADVLTPDDPWDSVDALLVAAAETDRETLVQAIEQYADGVFVAARVYLMARIDGEVDPTEQALYATLVDRFEVTPDDRAMIESLAVTLEGDPMAPPPARFVELYAQSSFAQG